MHSVASIEQVCLRCAGAPDAGQGKELPCSCSWLLELFLEPWWMILPYFSRPCLNLVQIKLPQSSFKDKTRYAYRILSICLGIVGMHDGTLCVCSEVLAKIK